MKRRDFQKSLAALLTTTAVSTSYAARTLPSPVIDTELLKTTIHVPGLQGTYKILQITDSHLSIPVDSEKEYEQYGARMHKAYERARHYQTGELHSPVRYFEEILQVGVKEKVDLLALTGDILNYPSAATVDFVKKAVEQTRIPHIYTAGNHDWHYEGMSGSADLLRKTWIDKVLSPLYSGGKLMQSYSIGSLNVLIFDNSTYQFNDEQVDFFKKELAKGKPTILFVHIPLYMPGMRSISSGDPEWGAKKDKNFEIERRERWPESGNNKATTAFLKEVMASKTILSVFAGHWHTFHAYQYQHINQVLTLPAANGYYRLIEIKGN